jgi:hypothetical protein
MDLVRFTLLSWLKGRNQMCFETFYLKNRSLMRSAFLIGVVILLGLASCNQDEKEPENYIYGYWNLVAITTQFQSSEIDKSQLDFEEKYVFNQDGTFIKLTTHSKDTGEKLQVPMQALGSYTFRPYMAGNENLLYELELHYDTNPEMAVNCGGDGSMEAMVFTVDKQLINSTWAACDGPYFIYSKGK